MPSFFVTTAAASLEFDTVSGDYNSAVKIDDNHFINFWSGESGDGYVQVFTVNTSTWAVTTAAARLEHDIVSGNYNSALKVDTNHFINFSSAENTDGYVQVFTVNTTTWAVTTAAADLEYDTSAATYNSAVVIDANHFINAWAGSGADGFAQVFTVNTTTWAVTTAAARLEFDTENGTHNSLVKVDTNHFLVAYQAVSFNGKALVLAVNTTTWAVTAAGSKFTFDTQSNAYNSLFQIDETHYLNTWEGLVTGTDTMAMQVFAVNTTTWAVTTAGSPFVVDGESESGGYEGRRVAQVDTNHFLIAYESGSESSFDGYMAVFEVNTSTWAITRVSGPALEFDTADAWRSSLVKVDTNHFINFWAGSGADGFVQIFTVQSMPSVSLNTADATETSDTTPTLDFTGTDLEVDSVRYTIQIDTANTFNSGSEQTITMDHVTDLGSDLAVNAKVNFAVSDHDNRILVVVITHDSGTPNDVNSVSYGNNALTQAKESTYGNNKHAEIWYLLNPLPGTDVVNIVSDAGRIAAAAYDYYNVDQTSPINATGSGQNTNDTPTTTIVPTVNNTVIIDVLCSDSGGTAGTDQTQRWTKSFSFNESRSSTKPLATAASTTMTWGSTAGDWAMAAIALKPSKAPMLSKISGTDSGFANPDTGGDTDPFNSGENIQYTVQSALSAGTYYWRVKGADPSGSTFYGIWSSIRSIIIESGGSFSQTCDEVVSLVDSLIRGPSKVASDSFSIVDIVLKDTSVTKSESFSIVDSLIKGYSSILAEVVAVVDVIAIAITNRTLSEIVTIVDSKLNDVSRILSEVVSIVDSVLKIGDRVFSEVVTIVDTALNTGGKILSEVITVVDSMGGMAITKVLNEVISIVDLVIRASDRVFNEVVSIVDSIVKGREKILEEIITVVDSIVNVIARELLEVISIVDSLLKTPVKTFSEVVTVVDEFTGKIIGRVFEESIVLVDSIVRVSSRIFSEVVSIVDSVLKTPSRVFSETIVVVDEIVRVLSKTLTEAITIVDSVLRDVSRVFSESFSIVDVLLKTSSRIFSEAITIVDVALNTTGKILSETFSLTDTFLREISKLLIENVVIVDVIVRVSSRVFSEVISLVDTFLSLTSRTFTEIISIVDSFFGNPGKELVEVVSIIDSLVKSTGHILSESISFTDSIVREIGKIMIESVILVDTIIKARSVTFSDEVSIVDTVLKTSGKVLSESVSIVDTVLYSTGKFFAESITVTDKLFRGFRWYQRLSTAFKSALRTGWYNRNNTSAMAKRRTGWYDKNNTDWQD